MSVSESGDGLSDVTVLLWTGYGLAALSVAVFLACIVLPSPLWTLVLLAMAVVSLVVVFRAPDVFETWGRDGRRGFNLLVGAPTLLLCALAVHVQFEDYTVPIAVTLVGAMVLVVAGMVVLSRVVMDSPLFFLMFAFVMGAGLSSSALAVVDVMYDPMPPATLWAPVLDRYVTHSARGVRNGHLRIGPFGGQRGTDLTVTDDLYAAHPPGSVICMLEGHGGVGLRWTALCGR